jgi:CRP/FNR family cyclic AMP-dependent transcriptional regulator
VAATVRRLTEATADLVFLDLPRRVAKVLLSQPRDASGVISPQLTQEQFARLAAGTRQSVNTALRGFEKRGWITVDGRDLPVRQPERSASSPSSWPCLISRARKRHRGSPRDRRRAEIP